MTNTKGAITTMWWVEEKLNYKVTRKLIVTRYENATGNMRAGAKQWAKLNNPSRQRPSNHISNGHEAK